MLICECGHAHEVYVADEGSVSFADCAVCDCTDMVPHIEAEAI